MPEARLIQDLLALAGRDLALEEMTPIPSHSGSKVFLVRASSEAFVAKVGPAGKLRQEIEKCRSWPSAVARGRRVLAQIPCDGGMALLGEYLRGRSLSEIFATGDADLSNRAARTLAAALESLWRETLISEPAPLVYARDIEARLFPLLLERTELRPLLEEIQTEGESGRVYLARLAVAEPLLRAPFTVLTHGDLTPDNVLYDAANGTVAFLDLARSGPGDPLLDVGKFVAAHVREELLGRPSAAAKEACRIVAEAARRFCEERGDGGFDRRLAISSARTLLGSARLPPPRRAKLQIREGLLRLAAAL